MSEKRYVHVTNNGLSQTGLTLTWSVLKIGSTGVNVSPQPAFTEVGGGWYSFEADPGIGEHWCGVIDASATVTIECERYISMLAGDNDVSKYSTAVVTPVYNAVSDTLQFMCMLFRNGQLIPSDKMTSAVVTVFDSTHAELFDVSGSSSTNGVFLLAVSNPDLSTGEGYYCTVDIIANGFTFSSVETIITLD